MADRSIMLPKSRLTYIVKRGKKKVECYTLWMLRKVRHWIRNMPWECSAFCTTWQYLEIFKEIFPSKHWLYCVEMLVGLLIYCVLWAQWSRVFPLVLICVITAIPITIVQVITLYFHLILWLHFTSPFLFLFFHDTFILGYPVPSGTRQYINSTEQKDKVKTNQSVMSVENKLQGKIALYIPLGIA